jgi:hypothetical protein
MITFKTQNEINSLCSQLYPPKAMWTLQKQDSWLLNYVLTVHDIFNMLEQLWRKTYSLYYMGLLPI